MQYICPYHSPLGRITLASNGRQLTGLWFEGQKYFAATLPPNCEEKDLPIFDQTRQWLNCYFCGEEPAFMPALALYASPFRLAVWEALRRIPYGTTVTYGEIARRIAFRAGSATASARAVGGAVGHNPISILVPCHRVIGSNGNLTGYAGGIERKIALLTLEGVKL